MEFNKESFQNFRKEAKEALLAVEEKFDIIINLNNISYEEATFTCKMEAKKKGVDLNRIDWEMNCLLYDLKKDDYGKEIVDPKTHKKYRICGLKTRNSKSPILIEDIQTNSQYKISVSFAKTLLKQKIT